MTKSRCEIRVGTSGWFYDHWRGRFYPENLPKSDWLSYYARHFDTVEINNTFYQLPKEQTFQKWYTLAPRGFLYTVKANRYITHIKKLKDTKDELSRFFERVEILKDRLGPILFQLPPSLRKNLDLLGSFLQLLPKNRLAVFEFRNETWYTEDTYRILEESGAGFCIHDLGGEETPRIITAGVIYIRFHGTTGRYAGNYSKPALAKWAKWIKENQKSVSAVYAYFNNDALAHAITNARTLKSLVQ